MEKTERPNALGTKPRSMGAKTSGQRPLSLAHFWLLVSLWLVLVIILVVDLSWDKTMLAVWYPIPVMIAGMFLLPRYVVPMTVGAMVFAIASVLEAHLITAPAYQLRLGGIAIACSLAAIASTVRTRAMQNTEEAQRDIDDAWDRLEAHIEDLKVLPRQLIQEKEQEHQIISRELHDNIAQVITAVRTRISLARTTSSKTPAWLKQELHSLQGHLDTALTDVRTLASELRPTLLDHCGFATALEKHANGFRERTNIDVELQINPNAATNLDPENLTHLFRIAQESMQNIEKHSGATRAWLRLEQCDGEILLEIGDNGRSFNDERAVEAQNNGHLGLLGMRERAELLGGSLHLHAIPSRGTTIRVTVPSRSNDGELDL